MNAPSTCDHQRAAAFLESDAYHIDDAVLPQHLDSCDQCRTYLEHEAASADVWNKLREHLPPGEFDLAGSAAFSAASVTRPSSGQPVAIAEVLDALSPTDDPHRLGRCGSYEVTGIVGVGGMGVVLKAVDPSLDRVVAVKVMAPSLANNDKARRRFAREAKAAAAVLHPNVVPIHSVCSDGAVPYLVMAYIRGGSLQKRLEAEGPLPVVEILRIGSQIAAGLAAAHEQGLVHRDIKPENVLLEEGVERVTITDFGLARAVDDNTVTQNGAIAGTPMYMSPEQAAGQPVDQQSDLFSLGSVLYSLCTGRPPFTADSSYGVMRQIIDETPPPVETLNTEIPAWLSGIVQTLMARDKQDRFASAADVHELLEACLGHVQQPDTRSLPPLAAIAPLAPLASVSPAATAATSVTATPPDSRRASQADASKPGTAAAAAASAAGYSLGRSLVRRGWVLGVAAVVVCLAIWGIRRQSLQHAFAQLENYLQTGESTEHPLNSLDTLLAGGSSGHEFLRQLDKDHDRIVFATGEFLNGERTVAGIVTYDGGRPQLKFRFVSLHEQGGSSSTFPKDISVRQITIEDGPNYRRHVAYTVDIAAGATAGLVEAYQLQPGRAYTVKVPLTDRIDARINWASVWQAAQLVEDANRIAASPADENSGNGGAEYGGANGLTTDLAVARICEAASISAADVRRMGGAKNLAYAQEMLDNHSLSLVLLTLGRHELHEGTATDFRYLTADMPEPSTLLEAMWSRDKTYASLILPHAIEACRFDEVAAGRLRGSVRFRQADLFAGRVNFAAGRVGDRWVIDQFELPQLKINIARLGDGNWRRVDLNNGNTTAGTSRLPALVKPQDDPAALPPPVLGTAIIRPDETPTAQVLRLTLPMDTWKAIVPLLPEGSWPELTSHKRDDSVETDGRMELPLTGAHDQNFWIVDRSGVPLAMSALQEKLARSVPALVSVDGRLPNASLRNLPSPAEVIVMLGPCDHGHAGNFVDPFEEEPPPELTLTAAQSQAYYFSLLQKAQSFQLKSDAAAARYLEGAWQLDRRAHFGGGGHYVRSDRGDNARAVITAAWLVKSVFNDQKPAQVSEDVVRIKSVIRDQTSVVINDRHRFMAIDQDHMAIVDYDFLAVMERVPEPESTAAERPTDDGADTDDDDGAAKDTATDTGDGRHDDSDESPPSADKPADGPADGSADKPTVKEAVKAAGQRGLFRITVNGRDGFINSDGEIVLPPAFQKAYPFSEGLAAVQLGGRWGFITPEGRMAIEPRFISAGPFASGRAVVQLDSFDDPFGYIDTKGRVVIEPQYDRAEQFVNGIARVGNATAAGKLLSRIADVGVKTDERYIDVGGREIAKPAPQYAGTGAADELIPFSAGDKMGYVDAEGRTVIAPRFHSCGRFVDGLALACEDRLFGYIDRTGQFVIPPRYQYANDFADGLAGVQLAEGKWGFIDREGKVVLAPRFNWIYGGFREGIAQVTVAGRIGYINKQGGWVW